MTTFRPPILSAIQPRYHDSSTPLQKRLYRYMRPLDQPVNVFVLSDNVTVVTDYGVTILPTSENGEQTTSSVAVPYPWQPDLYGTTGPPEGAEGGPWGTQPPFAWVYDVIADPTVQSFTLELWIKYWFRGGCTYPGISANLVTILTNAGYADYLT